MNFQHSITCYIGVAEEVITKDIVENIPEYQDFANMGSCNRNCHVKIRRNDNACPEGQQVD